LASDSKETGVADAKERALTLARQANKLAPESAFVQIVLAATLNNHLRLREAKPFYEMAYANASRHLDVPTLFGVFQMFRGNFKLATEAIDRAISVDPRNPRVWQTNIYLQYFSGNYEKALQLIDKLWSEFPSFADSDTENWFRFVCNYQLGRLELARKAAEATKDVWDRDWSLATLSIEKGDKSLAQSWIERFDKSGVANLGAMMSRVELLAKLGRTDEAIAALESEYRKKNQIAAWIKVDPGFRVLATDPRFTDLQRRIGLLD
jgi:tetratricopeptide (TPR) repeat protein